MPALCGNDPGDNGKVLGPDSCERRDTAELRGDGAGVRDPAAHTASCVCTHFRGLLRGLAPSALTCDILKTCYVFELWWGHMAILGFCPPPHPPPPLLIALLPLPIAFF